MAIVDLLKKKGIITDEQLKAAQEEVNRTGLTIEKALEKLGFISELDIAKITADSMGVAFIDLEEYSIDAEVVKLVPESMAKKYKAIPLLQVGDNLMVAMANPQDIAAIDEIRAVSRAGAIDAVLSTPDMIQRAIERYYSSLGNMGELLEGLTEGAVDKIKQKTNVAKDASAIAEEPPIIKLVNLLLVQAVKDRASDIHIEPEEKNVRIRYRIDGILHEVQTIPKHLQGALASRVKVMAKMDISETRNAQDGRIQLRLENKDLDLRVSTFPTMHGENIVLRILDKSSLVLGLADLGLGGRDLDEFKKIVKRPNGIILVTGPTGSGKTTTLYSALTTINSVDKNIITIEDPVEYEIPMIRQTQVNVRAGLTFANGLRSILRQDPDVIMVGEIRDKETAEIAIQASLTGHLVFSTLHTNDAASSLTRLIDMGVEPFLIASSIIGILAQRLVRVICPKCKIKYPAPPELISSLNLASGAEFYRGKGCPKCKDTGFYGRIGIFELLLVTEDIKNMVGAKLSASEIKKKAVSQGMQLLYDDGMAKVKAGITTIEEVLRVTEES